MQPSERDFEVWLSSGYGGDRFETIPTKTGQINREALLGSTTIGAKYWQNVLRGPVQSALDRQTKHLQIEIESGLEQHIELAKIRRHAGWGLVAPITDLLGGADFPDYLIWDEPEKLPSKASRMNVGGNVLGTKAMLVVAAIMTRNAAMLIAQYLDDSESVRRGL